MPGAGLAPNVLQVAGDQGWSRIHRSKDRAENQFRLEGDRRVDRRSLFSVAVVLTVWAMLSAVLIAGESISESSNSPIGNATPAPVTNKRVLIVITPTTDRSRTEMAKLEAPKGPLEILKQKGWKVGSTADDHIQIVDRTKPIATELQPVVSKLPLSDGPVVVAIENGEIARSFKRGCTTPLDQWTFGWLMTGNDDRPADFVPEPITVATTSNYRLRGNHWSVDGDWNPSKDTVVRHLRASHSNGIQAGWKIEAWSTEELRSLHDDIHDREEGFRGRYATATATAKSSSVGGAGMRKPGSR